MSTRGVRASRRRVGRDVSWMSSSSVSDPMFSGRHQRHQRQQIDRDDASSLTLMPPSEAHVKTRR